MLNCDSTMLLSALQSIEVPPEISESARSPAGAKVGMLYRAGEWEKAHAGAQDLATAEGSFWHGILHRQEEDWGNAEYWFRRVGRHAVYDALYGDAREVLLRNESGRWQLGREWDPIQFIRWCEEAAKKGSAAERAAITEIQVAEWRRLFAWCMG